MWGNGYAMQAYWYPVLSFGISIDLAKPMLDIHFLWFTFAFGRNAHITSQTDRQRHSCRGFLFVTDPQL